MHGRRLSVFADRPGRTRTDSNPLKLSGGDPLEGRRPRYGNVYGRTRARSVRPAAVVRNAARAGTVLIATGENVFNVSGKTRTGRERRNDDTRLGWSADRWSSANLDRGVRLPFELDRCCDGGGDGGDGRGRTTGVGRRRPRRS